MHMRLGLTVLLFLLANVCVHATVNDPYKVLGLDRKASAPDVKRAYKKLAVQYHPDKNPSKHAKQKFLDIQEAYEILNDDSKRREYDISGSMPTQRAYQEQGGYRQQSYYQQGWGGWASDSITSSTPILDRFQFFSKVFSGSTAWLIQIYSDSSIACRFAAPQWEKAAKDLKDVAKLGRMQYTADPALTAKVAAANSFLGILNPLKLQDLPLVVGYPADCNEFSCGVRYSGPLQAELLAQFIADRILELPQVATVTAGSLSGFLSRAPAHEVVMLALSNAPHPSLTLRRVAAEFADSIVTGRVWVDHQDSEYWEEKYGVRKLPAVIFFLGPGTAPVVHDAGAGQRLNLAQLAAQYRWPTVAQLRSDNAHALGCAWGHGVQHSTQAQACAVLVGRPGNLMLQARTKLAGVAQLLGGQGKGLPRDAAAAVAAYKSSNLRILWLDAGRQYEFCKYHWKQLGNISVQAICGRKSGWYKVLRFWEIFEPKQIGLLVYKPGAAKLSRWWNLPHRYSVFQESLCSDAWTDTAATWLSQFLDGSAEGVYQQEELPPSLVDDSGWPNFLQFNEKANSFWRSGMLQDPKLLWTLLVLMYRLLVHPWAFPTMLVVTSVLSARGSRLKGLAIFLTVVSYFASSIIVDSSNSNSSR